MNPTNGDALLNCIVRSGEKCGLIDPERCRAELSVDRDRGVMIFKGYVRGHEAKGRLAVEVTAEAALRAKSGALSGGEIPALANVVIGQIRASVAQAIAAN